MRSASAWIIPLWIYRHTKVYFAIGYTEVWILYPLFAFNAEPWKPNEDTTQLTLYPSGFPEVESGMTKSRFKMLSLVFSRGCPFTSVEWKVFDPKNTTAREIYALCNHSSPFIGLVTKMVMQKKITRITTKSLQQYISGTVTKNRFMHAKNMFVLQQHIQNTS